MNKPLARLGATPMSTTGFSYPWTDGDILYAADLNAAFGLFLPITGAGSLPSLTVTGNLGVGGLLQMGNNHAIQMADTDGSLVDVLKVDSSNDTVLIAAGSGDINLFGDTYVHGTTTLGGPALLSGPLQMANGQPIQMSNTSGVYQTVLYVDGLNNTTLTSLSTSGLIKLVGEADVSGNAAVAGNLIVAGNTNLGGTLVVAGSTPGGGTGAWLAVSGTNPTAAWTAPIGINSTSAMQSVAFFTASDRRHKTDIADLTADEAIDWLLRARARKYRLVDRDGIAGKPVAGFIAQEAIAGGRPDSVVATPSIDPRFDESDGFAPAQHMLSYDYQQDSAYLVAVVQSLLARVERLEAMVTR